MLLLILIIIINKECIVNSIQLDKKNRNTKQKALILDCLIENTHIHITVDDVCELLKARNAAVGRATVYRNLNQLESDGIVKKYTFMSKKGACFQYLGAQSICKEHYHLMCDKCGEVKHIEEHSIQKILHEIQTKYSFIINDTKTMFYGVCSRCSHEN